MRQFDKAEDRNRGFLEMPVDKVNEVITDKDDIKILQIPRRLSIGIRLHRENDEQNP